MNSISTYSTSSLNFDTSLIDSDALDIVKELTRNGFKAYLVGGSVRDILLGHTPKDFDISTSATPEQVKKTFKRHCILIGKRFRLAHVRRGSKIFEVATFRGGDLLDDSLITKDNQWGSPEEDAIRRDFTINALYYDFENDTIIDYVNGVKDIKNSLLRSIGDAVTRFKQDPVRMLRLLKFSSRFLLEVEESTNNALLSNKHEITKSSPARVLEELLKMFESGNASHFFARLVETKILYDIFPLYASIKKTILNSIQSYFTYTDSLISSKRCVTVQRGVIMGCLLFPYVDHHFTSLFLSDGKPLHLGVVQKNIDYILGEFFSPYLTVPKKLKGELSTLLHTQYRFTPIGRAPRVIKKTIQLPYFIHSLQFFNIRANLTPALSPLFMRWKNTYKQKDTSA